MPRGWAIPHFLFLFMLYAFAIVGIFNLVSIDKELFGRRAITDINAHDILSSEDVMGHGLWLKIPFVDFHYLQSLLHDDRLTIVEVHALAGWLALQFDTLYGVPCTIISHRVKSLDACCFFAINEE